MFILYDLIFIVFALVYLPYALIKGKWPKDFLARLGKMPGAWEHTSHANPNLWVHAVSVGEVLAIVDLVKRLKEKFPQYNIVCSTVTKTGNDLARKELKDSALVIYAPFDLSWVVRQFIKLIKPVIYISAETEIWPNLYAALLARNVPVVQVNGRISDKSFNGYKKIMFLTRKILKGVNLFCMQTPMDAQRIIMLGGEPARVMVLGNMKFDMAFSAKEFKNQDFGFGENDIIWVAGSTHPGEEEIILDVYERLKKENLSLRLIIAPRHIERSEEVMGIIKNKGYGFINFSQLKNKIFSQDMVLVMDTIGQLRDLYSIAKIVFVGKSLTGQGGQNIIEPAFFGKPIIVGPNTQNFKDIINIFLRENALIQVMDENMLEREMSSLLKDHGRIQKIGSAARRVVEQNQGATLKTIDAVSQFLK